MTGRVQHSASNPVSLPRLHTNSSMLVQLPDQTTREIGAAGLQLSGSECDLPASSLICLRRLQDDAALLENLSEHDLHVEHKVGGGEEWTLMDFVHAGSTTVVGPGMRFFISGRHLTGTFEVLAAAAASPAAVVAAGSKRPFGSPASTDPQLKRQRPGGPSSFRDEVGTSTQQQPAAALDVLAAPDLSDQDAPMHLLRVRGIPDWANVGFLGVHLSHLVCSNIRWALVMNAMLDLPWLLSACPDLAAAGHLVLVKHSKDPAKMQANASELLEEAGLLGRATVHAPAVHDYGTHHTKAFILQYAHGVRVIILTANFIYIDCNNKSQALYWQDFPRKDSHSPFSSPFEADLKEYVAALRLPAPAAQQARDILSQHDFSSARAALVASIPGYHTGQALHKWGHKKLQAVLSKEVFPARFSSAPAVAQFSSMGSLTEAWLTQEFRDSMSAGLAAASEPGGPHGRLGPPPAGPAGMQLVWPAVQEVQGSLEGWYGGSCVPGPAKNVNRPFLKPYYHRWDGGACGRQRALPHQKTFLRYKGQEVAWCLVTSHNLSKAAWGELQKKQSQLFIRSFELGALLLPSLEKAYQLHRHRCFRCAPVGKQQQQQQLEQQQGPAGPRPGMAQNTTVRYVAWQRGSPQQPTLADGVLTVPLPLGYSLPPVRYQPGDKPWEVDTPWPGLDTWGCTIDRALGQAYGLLESMEWGDVVAALRIAGR